MPSEDDIEVEAPSTLSRSRIQRTVKGNFSASAQFWALLVKNATLQRRNYATNVCQLLTPLAALLLILGLQIWIDSVFAEDLEAQPSPPLREPFLILTEVDRLDQIGDVVLLYTNNTGVGQYEPGGGTGLLGEIINDTLSIKFLEFSDSDLFPEDLDDYVSRPRNFSFQQEASKADIDAILFGAFAEVPLYPNAFEFQTVDTVNDVYRVSVFYNYTVTRGRDVPGALSLITNALSRFISGGNSIIELIGIKNIPRDDDETTIDLASLAGSFFYALILHQLLPVFLSAIAYEKEHRLREIMKMMGLKMWIYWVVLYLFNYILYLGVMLFLIVFGWIFQFRFFTVNNFLLYFLLFLIWGHTLIAMSFLLSVFFNKAKTATIVGYFLILAICFICLYLVDSLVSDIDTPGATLFGLSIVPPFALYRGLVYLGNEVAFNGPGMKLDDIANEDLNMLAVYGHLIVEWFIMLIMAYYLENVFPSGQGVKRHPLFFLAWLKKVPPFSKWFPAEETDYTKTEHEDTSYEPTDVAAARQKTYAIGGAGNALRVLDIKKRFGGSSYLEIWWSRLVEFVTRGRKKPKLTAPYFAVNNVAFSIAAGECVGILGPNGAGKTTLISILTGLFEPSSGTAEMFGLSIKDQIDQVHMLTGVCPQHDILWGNMTAKEHLLFYGRLKNLKGPALHKAVRAALVSVNLREARNKLSSKYSGGMKRRLSVAISLMAEPKMVFLDEPSTGLDPKSKRGLWETIAKRKKKSALLLTTHSMEEAEALCDRVIVMAGGQLKAIGPSSDLKRRFGAGYKLTVHASPECDAAAHKFVKKLLPGCILLNSLAGTRNYRIDKKSVVLSQVFSEMEANRERLGISDWGICNTTLEEVFHSIVSPADENTVNTEEDDDDDQGGSEYTKGSALNVSKRKESAAGDSSGEDESQDKEKTSEAAESEEGSSSSSSEEESD
ncbi:ABC transporter, ATPbinding domain containing protein [Balamuthia mandrillaris]